MDSSKAVMSIKPATVRNHDILEHVVVEHLWRVNDAWSQDLLSVLVTLATTSKGFLEVARKKLYGHVSKESGQVEAVIEYSELGGYIRTIDWKDNWNSKEVRKLESFRQLVECCNNVQCIRIESDVAETLSKNLYHLSNASTAINLLELSIISSEGPLSTPMVLGDVLASFSNLRHVSFFGIRLLNSTTLPITATHMTFQNCNSLTFTSLLQCATNLKDLELYGNEFSSIPLSLTLKSPNLKQFTYNNSTNNLDSTTSAIFFKELAKFISSFPNLEVIDLWIPHYDSSLVQMTLLEEAEFLDAIPSSIISINFLGAGSPSAQAFQRASHRWNNLESIRFGVNAWKGIENCCGWTEKEIRSLEFPKVYYSVNEGRRFSSTFTDLPTPVYAHTYVFDQIGPGLFEECIFDSDIEVNE